MSNTYSLDLIKKSALVLFPTFLIFYELVVNLSNDMYIPASTYLVDYFHTNAYFIQLTFTSWFAGSMIVNPVLGILSDNLCRKKILLITGVGFMAATLYCAISTDIYLFIIARFIQGVTVTTIVICGYALVHDIYDDKQAIILIAWMSGALITAPMLGPLMGGYIIYFLDWKAIFLILTLSALLALIGIYFFMPKKQVVDVHQKIDWRSEFAIYVKIMTHVEFMLITLISALLFGGIIAWITASPFLLIGVYAYSPVAFGFAQVPIFGSYILGTFALKLALKWDVKETTIVTSGIIIIALVSIAMYLLQQSGTQSVEPLIIMISCYSFVFGLISAPLNRLAVKSLSYGLGKTMAMFDFTLGLFATGATILINVGANNVLALVYCTIATFSLLSSILYAANHMYCQWSRT